MNSYQFRANIRKSLANENLQAALDFNAERRSQGRVVALESLPNAPERRQQAHAIRADVIDHLDEYLEQFIQTATKNGMIVHRAQDANEAIKIFLELVGANSRSPLQETLIAKSNPWSAKKLNSILRLKMPG